MISYAEYEGKQLMQENEELKKDEFYLPTEEEKRKFRKTLDKKYHILRTKKIFHNLLEKFNRIAIVFFVLVILLFTSFFTVEAVRVKILNLVVNMQKEYTEIHLGSKDSGNTPESNLYINWKNAYAPTKVPEGFQIVTITDNNNLKAVEYENDDGDFILFQQRDENSSMNADTENTDKVVRTIIQGNEALLINKAELTTLIWYNDSYIFMITVQSRELENEDIIEIAESVTLIE